MCKLLIATNNKGKIEEIQNLLKGTDIELVTPAQIGIELDVTEDGLTYAENASKKAIAFAQASNLVSLADDSGLEVDALDGAPGLYSARYGASNGEKLTDADRRRRGTGGFGYDPIFLLSEMGKTMAELSMEEKNRLSHRARAVLKAGELYKKVSR
jgi:XTP/dITP diphosphohydrolase